MSALSKIWAKLSRSKAYREAFVSSQAKRGIPNQIRILIRQRGWTQADLAENAGLKQGAISRACDPDYGNLTLNTLIRVAAGFDVAFVGKFVPFSDLAKWYTNLSEPGLEVPNFADDSVEPTETRKAKAASGQHALFLVETQTETMITRKPVVSATDPDLLTNAASVGTLEVGIQ